MGEEIKYNDRRIHITDKLVEKLLEGEEVFIEDIQSYTPVLPGEKEELRYLTSAKILKGRVHDVISIELQKALCLTNQKKDYYKIKNYDIWDSQSEEMYRFPWIKDISWLKKGLRIARKKSHSYYMNRV